MDKITEALKSIELATTGDKTVLKQKWLQLLYLTNENQFNPEHFKSKAWKNYTLTYVYKTIQVLDRLKSTLPTKDAETILEVLKWSEVSKCGLPHQRKKWNYLLDHAISSAEVYKEYTSTADFNNEVYELIKIHGDVGQYSKGELWKRPITTDFFMALSECVIKGLNEQLWDGIDLAEHTANERLAKLCGVSTVPNINSEISEFVEKTDFWYSSIFTIIGLEKTKKLLNRLTQECATSVNIVDFQPLQNTLIYYHNNDKKIDYCAVAMMEEDDSNHAKIKFEFYKNRVQVSLDISEVGIAIDTFYRKLNQKDLQHKNAVLKILDHFNFRSDAFDRLGNENDYLAHMNSAVADKSKIVEFINPQDYVLDVGPGGGVMMEMYSGKTKNVFGIDISKEVCDRLTQKSQIQKLDWTIFHADFFSFETDVKFDKIVFCSCIHELFSFVEYEGKKFNKDIVKAIINKAKTLLKPNGMIIVRDGIAASNNKPVQLHFKDLEFESLFNEYVNNFEGFDLKVAKEKNAHEYTLPYNSMMEALYTINWGPDSLPFEIKEWYGYYTKEDWEKLGATAFKSYLQKEYCEHILPKVDLFDVYGPIELPNSNCLVIIE